LQKAIEVSSEPSLNHVPLSHRDFAKERRGKVPESADASNGQFTMEFEKRKWGCEAEGDYQPPQGWLAPF